MAKRSVVCKAFGPIFLALKGGAMASKGRKSVVLAVEEDSDSSELGELVEDARKGRGHGFSHHFPSFEGLFRAENRRKNDDFR